LHPHSVRPQPAFPFRLPFPPTRQLFQTRTLPQRDMAVTYALPQIPTRPARPARSPEAEDSASRRLTPYPDPKKAFPLSDDHDDNKRKHDRDPKRKPQYNPDSSASPELVKPIEINFSRISKKLRRSPSNPPGPVGDRSKLERKSSLPSLGSSSFDNFASGEGALGEGRPRRRDGWLIPDAFVQDYLKDLKRSVVCLAIVKV
jgi:hypothetical protein